MSNTDQIANWEVLIVDDDLGTREVIAHTLSFYGATVHTANNGTEGLDLLKHISPTMILLDLTMPEMDGWNMFEEVRRNPDLAHIPVIAVTAHAMVGDRERVLNSGFDHYIAKPFTMQTLLASLLSYFESGRSSRANMDGNSTG